MLKSQLALAFSHSLSKYIRASCLPPLSLFWAPHTLNMISTTDFYPKQKLPLYGFHGAQMVLSSVEELDESQNNKLYILMVHTLSIIKISL